MLMQIGPVGFDLSFNLDGVTRETSRDFAEKPVIGTMPHLEDMGDAIERVTLAGRLVPLRLGGLSSLEVLHRSREQGLPQLLVRGDGKVMGWFVIMRIVEQHSFLDPRGVGQLVDMTIELSAASQPTAQNYFSALWGLIT